MAINIQSLFQNRLGKGFKIIKDINTSRGTTIPALMLAYKNAFDSASLLVAAAGVPYTTTAELLYKSQADSVVETIRQSLEKVLIEVVDADTPLKTKDLSSALAELVRQFPTVPDTVDASTVSATASAITGNGNGVLVVSTKRPDGLVNETMYAETIKVECANATTPATFTAYGKAAVANKLSSDWPGGSGIAKQFNAIDAGNSLLGNGSFDDFDDLANAPDEWIVSVGTIGTTVKSTLNEVQTVEITGAPTAGTYQLNITNAASKVQTTEKIPWDAVSSVVQEKIQALKGFEKVTVTHTGGSPNFTHTITFKGVAGNVAAITTINNLNGGAAFTITQSVNGSVNAYSDQALEFDSDGAELTTINRTVALQPLAQYAFNAMMLADVVPAAGVITVDLVDGIGGTVINDQQGTANSFTVTCSALTTSFVAKTGVFRTPKVLPPIVYLRIRISTAVSAGSSIFIDHAALGEMTSLYAGGPEAAIFSGNLPFTTGEPGTLPDYATITVTNDRAGEFQDYFERAFDMAAKGLILASNGAGAETLPDSWIT